MLEQLRDERTLGEIAAEHQINPNQITNWRREFLEKAPAVFDEPKTVKVRQKAEREAAEEKLYVFGGSVSPRFIHTKVLSSTSLYSK